MVTLSSPSAVTIPFPSLAFLLGSHPSRLKWKFTDPGQNGLLSSNPGFNMLCLWPVQRIRSIFHDSKLAVERLVHREEHFFFKRRPGWNENCRNNNEYQPKAAGVPAGANRNKRVIRQSIWHTSQIEMQNRCNSSRSVNYTLPLLILVLVFWTSLHYAWSSNLPQWNLLGTYDISTTGRRKLSSGLRVKVGCSYSHCHSQQLSVLKVWSSSRAHGHARGCHIFKFLLFSANKS